MKTLLNSMVYHKWLSISAVGFGIIYTLISFFNHICFRTYALDLGLYTKALYEYRSFELAHSLMTKPYYEPTFGVHFDLYLPIFSPLSFVFGTYTLLVVQIVALLFGGIGIFKFFRIKCKNHSKIPLLAALYFWSFFGVFSAVSYDYHSVAVAACLIPWWFIAIEKQQVKKSFILIGLIIISQENVSLWMSFVALFSGFYFRKTGMHKALFFQFLISLLYFIIVLSVVIPEFSMLDSYSIFHYSVLGESPLEALKALFSRPLESIMLLFTNHLGNPEHDFIKLEFIVFLLVSGFYLLFKKPLFLFMLLPILAQKLFHDNVNMWSFGGQYVIEMAPTITIGVFLAILSFKNQKTRKVSLVLVMLGSLLCTVRMMDSTVQFTDKARIRFYQKKHYTKNYDVSAVHQALKIIPAEASVSAQTCFVPHLCLRENIFQFPKIEDATYIVFSKKEGTYPINQKEFDLLTSELLNSDLWEIETEFDEFFILKQRQK